MKAQDEKPRDGIFAGDDKLALFIGDLSSTRGC